MTGTVLLVTLNKNSSGLTTDFTSPVSTITHTHTHLHGVGLQLELSVLSIFVCHVWTVNKNNTALVLHGVDNKSKINKSRVWRKIIIK